VQYDLIRLVLVSRDQTSLFERRSATGAALSREEWLRQVFGKEIVFSHRKIEFHYVPQSAEDDRLVVGQVGRKVQAVENEPPEQHFAETRREHWRAALVIVDPSHHEDGQKLACEARSEIGAPLGIIKSLCDHINASADEPYVIEASSILDHQTFLDFERINRGDITSISFALNAPDVFGIRDDMTRELAELRDNEKARKVTISLQNQDGLKLDDDRVRQTVQYASDGGGEIVARTRTKKRFVSSRRGKTVSVIQPNDADIEALSTTIAHAIRSIFGGPQ
jgi:hypothetical protein